MARWPGDPHKERTSFGRLSRSQLMARVASKGNRTTEGRFLTLLRQSGISGWRRNRPLIGRPDFVWPSSKLAVFLDGCFWHGHRCGKNIHPRTNANAWEKKITANRRRDRRVTQALRRRGWVVLRIWECHLTRRPQQCVARVLRVLTCPALKGTKRRARDAT
jgi:DNA mismatch endonuclease (patch repair protein)